MPLDLFQLLADALALQPRHMVNEQLAFQVINLMLQAYRQQTIGLQFEQLAIAIQRLDQNPVRPLHQLVEAGYRQAALLIRLGVTAKRRDLRV